MKTACDAASNGRGRVIVVTAWALGCALENEAILAQITEGVSA